MTWHRDGLLQTPKERILPLLVARRTPQVGLLSILLSTHSGIDGSIGPVVVDARETESGQTRGNLEGELRPVRVTGTRSSNWVAGQREDGEEGVANELVQSVTLRRLVNELLRVRVQNLHQRIHSNTHSNSQEETDPHDLYIPPN